MEDVYPIAGPSRPPANGASGSWLRGAEPDAGSDGWQGAGQDAAGRVRRANREKAMWGDGAATKPGQADGPALPALFATRGGIKTRVAVHQPGSSFSARRPPMASVAASAENRKEPSRAQHVDQQSTPFGGPSSAPHSDLLVNYRAAGRAPRSDSIRQGHRKGWSDATVTSAESSTPSWGHSLSGTQDDGSDRTAATSTWASSSGTLPREPNASVSSLPTSATEPTLREKRASRIFLPGMAGLPHSQPDLARTFGSQGTEAATSSSDGLDFDFGVFASETPDLASTLGASFRRRSPSPAPRRPRQKSDDDADDVSKRDTITSLSDLLKRSSSHAKRLTLRPDDFKAVRGSQAADASASAAPHGVLSTRSHSSGSIRRKPAPSLLDLDLSGAGPTFEAPSDVRDDDSDTDSEDTTPVRVRQGEETAPSLQTRPFANGPGPPASAGLISHERSHSNASSTLSANKDLPPTPSSATSNDSGRFRPPPAASSTAPFLKRSLSRLRPTIRPFPSSYSINASTSDLSTSAASSLNSTGLSVSTKGSGVSRVKRFVDKVRGREGKVSIVADHPPGPPPPVSSSGPPPRLSSRRKASLPNLLNVFQDQGSTPGGSNAAAPTSTTPRRSIDMLRPTLGRRRTEEQLVNASRRDEGGANDARGPSVVPRRSLELLRGKLTGARKSTDNLRSAAAATSANGTIDTVAGGGAQSRFKTPPSAQLRSKIDQRSPPHPSSPVSGGPPHAGLASRSQPLTPTAQGTAPMSDARDMEATAVAAESEPQPVQAVAIAEWEKLGSALENNPNMTRQATISVVAGTLVPLLRSEETRIRFDTPEADEDMASQMRAVLFQWLDVVLGELKQAQPTSRGICLDAAAAILESPRLSASELDRRPEDTQRYRQSLVNVLKFAIDKLNEKAVYANTLVFSGRMLALAFFRLEGVAHKLLSSLPPVKRTALKRVLDELGPPSSTNPGGSRFPDHLAHLAFVDLTSYCRLFGSGQQSGSEPLVREGEVEVEMSGNWLIRWTASDSDLPFAFYRSYFRQLSACLDTAPADRHSINRLVDAPGFLFVTASFLDKCDSLVHRSLRSVTTMGPNNANFNAGESANLAMGAKPRILELAHRRLVSTALDIVGGSPRAAGDPEEVPGDASRRRRCFGPLINVWVRAIAKRTSMWDTRSVFLLLDLLDGLFYTLLYTAPFMNAQEIEQPPRLVDANLALFDFPFVRDVLRIIFTSADNTVCIMRTVAFVYAQFEPLTKRPHDRDALCLGLLLDPPVFEHLFLHWNSGVRGYFLRLLVWRLSRVGTAANGQSGRSPGAVKILLTFNSRLDAVRDRHDKLSPASDIIPDSEAFQAKRSTICSTRGVTDEPWAIDELPQGDVPEVVNETSVRSGDEGDKAGSVPKVVSWLKVVRRLGSGGNRKDRDLALRSYEPFPPMEPLPGETDGEEPASESRIPSRDEFATPTRKKSTGSSRRGSGAPDSPTFYKFEFELGTEVPRSDAFDSPSTPGRPGDGPSSPMGSPVPPARPLSDGAVSPLRSPRVSTRFSKRASLLPPAALVMLRSNPEASSAAPELHHRNSNGRSRQGGEVGYPEKKHPYAVRALAEYEQSLEEEHEWREKVEEDEENEGKALADLVPRLGVLWPQSFEDG